MSEETFLIDRSKVASETIDNETIVLNLESGVYYNFSFTGSDVWQLLEKGASVRAIGNYIGSKYSASSSNIETDIHKFVQDLLEENLISRATETRKEVEIKDPDGTNAEYCPPTFQKFTDMEQLIKLDPIHEVDEEGWPWRKEE